MKQYCRYCENATPCDGNFVCEANAPCGNNGCGREYPEEKAKRLNHCKAFEFNPNDLLREDEHGNFRQYHPRGAYRSRAEKQAESGQISFEEALK